MSSHRSLALVTLAAALLVSACGGDEDEAPLGDTQTRPAPQEPAVDTTLGDTADDRDFAEGPEGGPAGAAGPGGAVDPDAPQPPGGGDTGGEAGEPAASAETGTGDPGGAAGTARSYTVQVGAFTNPETARYWEERLATQGMPVWISMAEVEGRTFYRLRVGAVESVDDARALGGMIMDRYEWPVWVAPLTPADRPPAGAVERTERLLRSD